MYGVGKLTPPGLSLFGNCNCGLYSPFTALCCRTSFPGLHNCLLLMMARALAYLTTTSPKLSVFCGATKDRCAQHPSSSIPLVKALISLRNPCYLILILVSRLFGQYIVLFSLPVRSSTTRRKAQEQLTRTRTVVRGRKSSASRNQG